MKPDDFQLLGVAQPSEPKSTFLYDVSQLPSTDDEVVAHFQKCFPVVRRATAMVNLYNNKRNQGMDTLEAYEFTLKTYIEIIDK